MSDRQRLAIAATAAKLIAESGFQDWQQAKVKAAQQMGFGANTPLPRNSEIELALAAHQATFSGSPDLNNSHGTLRDTAIEAMRFIKQFKPLITGPMVESTPTAHSIIELHTFSDWPDMLNVFFEDNEVEYEVVDSQFRYANDQHASYPSYCFEAGGIPLKITVFPERHKSNPPLSSVTGKALKRLTLQQFTQL